MPWLFFFFSLFYSLNSFSADMSLEAIEKRIAPVGQVNVEAENVFALSSAMTHTEDPGEKIYESNCVVCHGSGVAGAPVLGNMQMWSARLKQGEATLVAHVIQGYKLMPPKGTCIQCSDADIKAAVEYMIKQVK